MTFVSTRFNVDVVAPFRLDLTAWALRRREKNIIDRWDGQSYLRVWVHDNVPIKVVVRQDGRQSDSTLEITLHGHDEISAEAQTAATVIVRRMLGADVDLRPFHALAKHEPSLTRLARQFRGVKPPRFPTIFEALTNAIACQQVSLDAGISALNRLTETYGVVLADEDGTMHAFPRPEDLAHVSEEALNEIGFSRQKARAITSLAYGVTTGAIDLDHLESLPNGEATTHLQSIRGIGRWSAEYAMLRGLGRSDVFPGDDVGGQNNLQRLFHLDAKPNYEAAQQLTTAWRPYAGFVYFHLLLQKLAGKGLL